MPPDGKLIIETPEQTVLEFTLAGIGSRALALGIDSLLQLAVLIVAGIAAALISQTRLLPALGEQWVSALLIFTVFLLQLGYFAFFEAIWNGQTPGKRWSHLRVIADSGRPIGAQAAILRNLLRIIDALPAVYAIGIISSLISSQNKRLGDFVAGTVVIHEKPLQPGRLLWDAPAVAHMAGMLGATQSRALSVSELQLIEAFLDRRESVPTDVRRGMARQIAEKLSDGAAIPQEVLQDPERFLEGLAERNRNLAHFR